MSGIRRAVASDLERVRRFYTDWDYRGPLEPTATVLLALSEVDNIVGLLRLVPEHGTTVLRGMRVDAHHQRRGIDSALLQVAAAQLGTQACYCLPYDHLVEFYGQIGFQRIEREHAPEFLARRIAEYERERPDRFCLMFRPAGEG